MENPSINSVVLINQSSGFLVVDDLNAYCTKYDRVSLISGTTPKSVRPLNPKVTIDRICRFDKTSTFKRIYSWCWGSIQVFFMLLTRYRGYYVVFYTNPPLACFCGLLLRNRFSIVEYDIYPDALSTIGITKGHFVYDLWAILKRKLYKRAERIFTLCEGMKELLTQYGPADKINVVPLWSASEGFRPIPKEQNIFIQKEKLEGKFIVLYSGNVGYTHSVEQLVNLAEIMVDEQDIHFLIIGEGKKKQELQDEVAKKGLSNVTFLPYQDFDMLPYSLSVADIGVITLDENVARVSVPSKTFNLLAVGAPILAIASADTEMNRLIMKYQNGRCIPKTELEQMADYILEVKNNPSLKQRLSDNSITASKDFTFENAKKYLRDCPKIVKFS